MNRLFVFGCSFTNWCWPTWADLLGLNYENYENWGRPGIGNRAIAEKISECHVKNNFTKDDTIIIQWTSYTRYDWYKDIIEEGENEVVGWEVHQHSSYYKKYRPFFEKIYSERAYVMHSLNIMCLIKEFLSAIGCKWYMTSLSDIRNLGYDSLFYDRYDDKQHQKTVKTLKEENSNDWILYKSFPEFKIYENIIWNDSENWLSPMFSNVRAHKSLLWSFPKDNYIEFHPTPRQHSIWLENSLGFLLKENYFNEKDVIIDAFEKLKDKEDYTSDQFRDLCEILTEKLAEKKYNHLKKIKLGF